MKARAVYYVRTGEREYKSEEEAEREFDRMTDLLAKTVDDYTNEGILTVGVSYYHDKAKCSGHASVFEECNAT